jgi:hypothetical protein
MDDPAWSESTFDEEFDEDLRDRIKVELDPGERVLWAGRPQPKKVPIEGGAIFLALLDLVLILVAAACFIRAFRSPLTDNSGPIFFGVLALIFAFFTSLGLISGAKRRRRDRENRQRTCYALTDRRVIIWQAGGHLYSTWQPGGQSAAIQVVSHERAVIKSIHRLEYPDGSGDVVICRSEVENAWLPGNIEGVADVRRVERLFRDVLLGENT